MEKNLSVDDIDWGNWTPDRKCVIVFIVDNRNKKILLIDKKTGFGAGKVNGPGGGIEKGETAAQAAVRECREEVFLTPLNPEKRAELYFQFVSGYRLLCEAFFSYDWNGIEAESAEAKPFWCDLDKIPWEQMWEDDRIWLPLTLDGKKVRGFYICDETDIFCGKTTEADNFAY